jgi:uracil permease
MQGYKFSTLDQSAVDLYFLFGGPPVTTYGEVTGAVMLTRHYNPAIMTWAAFGT